MSHFLTLVIGPDPDAQLAPYHEFECTGIDDEYIQDIDITDELIDEYTKRSEDYRADSFVQFCEKWSGQYAVPYGTEPDLKAKHKYGYVEYLIDNPWIRKNAALKDSYRVIRRTNPQKHWDWFQIGGRYTGFLKLKSGVPQLTGDPSLVTRRTAPEGYGDCCLLDQIDIEGMRLEAAEWAAKNWDDYHALVDPHPAIVPWEVFRLKVEAGELSLDDARKEYHAQPAVKALNADPEMRFYFDPEHSYAKATREEYIERARDSALVPFALVKDSQWYERGSMGWWGMVSDEKNHADWNREISRLIDTVPGETLFTVIDCHI